MYGSRTGHSWQAVSLESGNGSAVPGCGNACDAPAGPALPLGLSSSHNGPSENPPERKGQFKGKEGGGRSLSGEVVKDRQTRRKRAARTEAGRAWRNRWRARVAKGGSFGSLHTPTLKGRASGGIRGRITEFSRGSRKRMLEFVNSIDQAAVPVGRLLFVTLTYPGQDVEAWGQPWPKRPEQWEGHLKAFGKRLERFLRSEVPAIWKKEFQQRGAPHFHLLLLVPAGRSLDELRAWVSLNWYEVVGSGQETHRASGTQVDRVNTWRGVMSYAAKYLGKSSRLVDQETGEIRAVGRFWGVWRREGFPVQFREVTLSRGQWCQCRRWVLRYLGWRRSGGIRGLRCFAPAAVWDGFLAYLTRQQQDQAQEDARLIDQALRC